MSDPECPECGCTDDVHPMGVDSDEWACDHCAVVYDPDLEVVKY